MYIHLHNHFLIDSSIKIPDAISKIKTDGQPAIAITDHNLVSLHFKFYDECVRQNIKPILGCECYFVDDAEIKGAASGKEHIIIFAKNIDGLANLYGLVNESRLKYTTSDKVSVIDWRLLEKYKNGLIVTNACIYGTIANAIVKKNDVYLKRADRFVNMFGDDFFFELGYHYFPEQFYANEQIIKLAEKFGKTAMIVNDAHHLNKEDWYIQNMIFKKSFNIKDGGGSAETQDSYLKTELEMSMLGYEKKYLEQTVRVADRIENFNPAELFETEKSNNVNVCACSKFLSVDALTAVKWAADYFKFDLSNQAELLDKLDKNISLQEQISANNGLSQFFEDNTMIKKTALKLENIVYDIRPDYSNMIQRHFNLPVMLFCGALELSQFPADGLPENLKIKITPASAAEKNKLAKIDKLNYGIELYNLDEYENSIKILKALEADNEFGETALYYIANGYFMNNKYSEAIKYYERLYPLKLDMEKKYWALYFYGWILYKYKKNTEKAIKIFTEATEIAPSKPNAYYAFGFIFFDSGDYTEARRNFQLFIDRAKNKDRKKIMNARNMIAKIEKK